MSTVIVNAQLFRAAYSAVSTEETRYYLNGVHIERHPSGAGAVLVATDGHRMMVVRDHEAILPPDFKPCIVRINKAALRACKPVKRDEHERALSIDLDAKNATVIDGNKLPTAICHDCLIDGTFPDWQRVVPSNQKYGTEPGQIPTFDPKYLADFCAVAKDLSDHGALRIESNGEGSPALVKLGTPNAFGVLMPKRGNMENGLPDFMNEIRYPAQADATDAQLAA